MGRPRYQNQQVKINLSNEDLTAIIGGGDVVLLVKKAEEIGHALSEGGLKTNQIRNIYGTVRQIHSLWSNDNEATTQTSHRQIQLLKPKIAYQAARNREVKPLSDVLTPAIDLVGDNRESFQNFVDFFEAILAYHMEAGGR